MVHYSVLCEWNTMAMVPTLVPKSDIHTIIRFLTPENDPGHEIHHRLSAAYKNLNIVKYRCRIFWIIFVIKDKVTTRSLSEGGNENIGPL